jgi:hypothetical protein
MRRFRWIELKLDKTKSTKSFFALRTSMCWQDWNTIRYLCMADLLSLTVSLCWVSLTDNDLRWWPRQSGADKVYLRVRYNCMSRLSRPPPCQGGRKRSSTTFASKCCMWTTILAFGWLPCTECDTRMQIGERAMRPTCRREINPTAHLSLQARKPRSGKHSVHRPSI